MGQVVFRNTQRKSPWRVHLQGPACPRTPDPGKGASKGGPFGRSSALHTQICIYVYIVSIYVYIYICIRIYKYVYIYVHENIYIHIYICIHMCMCIYAYTYVYIDIRLRVHIQMCFFYTAPKVSSAVRGRQDHGRMDWHLVGDWDVAGDAAMLVSFGIGMC